MESEKTKQYFQRIVSDFKGTHGFIFTIYLFFIFLIQTFLTQEDGSPAKVVLSLPLLLVLLCCICPFILRKGEALQITLQEAEISRKEKAVWIFFFFLLSFIIMLHWYLAYYPGAFSSDAFYQYKQALSGEYNDWKPILQTLITFTLPTKLTGRPESIVLFQMIEYSGILAYMAYVLLKYSNRCFATLSLLYILLNPVTENMVVYPWKDVTFAMSAVLLMVLGLQIHITNGQWLDSRKRIVFLGIVLAVTSIVRHNGFLFTVPFLLAVLIRIDKKKRMQILLLLLLCIGVVKGPLRMSLEVPENWNHTARVMGLPMTVLGNVAKESPESLDKDTKEFMYSVASPKEWKEVYTCGSFNSLKWVSNQPAIEEAGAAKILWMTAKATVKAPVPALKGLFGLTDMVYTINGDLDWNLSPAMSENEFGLEFREYYDRGVIENYTDYSRTGIFRYLFWYVGIVNLVVIFAILCKCRFRVKSDWKKLLFALPLLCYNFGTMLLLPGNDFRYFYLSFPVCPIILLILFGEKVENQDREEVLEQETDEEISIQKIFRRLAVLTRAEQLFLFFVILLSGSIIIGGKIDVTKEPYFHNLFLLDFIWMGILCWLLYRLGKVLLVKMNSHMIVAQRMEKQKRWWPGAFLILTIAWIPYLFAFYPGIITADSVTSLLQVEDISILYNHIPIAYTLLIAAFARIGWKIGDANFGICLFSIAQMLMMAAVLSYSVYWVRTRISKNKIISVILILFYGLNPVIALYSITMWKDVLFSAWIVLFCLFLADVGMSKGEILERKSGLVWLGVLFLLVAFGRNNGIYVVILSLGVLLICYKNIRRKLLAAGGGIVLLILLVQGPGYQALEIDQAGFAESVGIPIQQISYTIIQDGGLAEKDEEFIEKIIPVQTIKECYSPISADNIKFNQEFDTEFFEENKLEFLKLYLKLLPRHLPSYVESYLSSTVGFWHIEPIGWLTAEGIHENEMGIFGVDYLKECFHLNWKDGMSAAIEALRKWPVTNVGLLVWIVFFFIVTSFIQKQSWKALTALPLAGCWLTIMIATPVSSQFRYVYYYHLMIPIICILLFTKIKKEELHGQDSSIDSLL